MYLVKIKLILVLLGETNPRLTKDKIKSVSFGFVFSAFEYDQRCLL